MTADSSGDQRDVRLTLSLAWAFVLFNYIYADIGFFAQIMISPALTEKFQAMDRPVSPGVSCWRPRC
jgi:hypothetical protein